MGLGAALAPVLGGALGPAGMALSAAPKVAGLFGAGGSGGAAPAPPMPTPNPAFRGLFGAEDDMSTPAGPPIASPAEVTQRPMLAADRLGPGQTETRQLPQPKMFEDRLPGADAEVTKAPVSLFDDMPIADETSMTPEQLTTMEDAAGVGPKTSALDTPVETQTSSTMPVRAAVASVTPQDEKPQSLFDGMQSGIDYVQDWLGESGTNPLFQTGMGLLASGYDSRINPYVAVANNLANVQPNMIAGQTADMQAQKQQADVAKAAEEKKLNDLLAAIGMQAVASEDEPRSQQAKGRASVIRR